MYGLEHKEGCRLDVQITHANHPKSQTHEIDYQTRTEVTEECSFVRRESNAVSLFYSTFTTYGLLTSHYFTGLRFNNWIPSE